MSASTVTGIAPYEDRGHTLNTEAQTKDKPDSEARNTYKSTGVLKSGFLPHLWSAHSCHDRRSEIPMVEGRLKSCSTEMGDLGGTGNKYDAGRCGISDGTLGNASKMSRSNVVSFLEEGEMESNEPGASGMMGGSIGDCSGITSSGCPITNQLFCNRSTTGVAHRDRPT